MAYSPPLDSFAGVLMALTFYYALPAFLAFFGVIIVEIIVLWHSNWGSFLYSLITSFVINLISTLVGIVLTYVVDIVLSVSTFFLMLIISVVIEGMIMIGMNRSRHELKSVCQIALAANVISYIFLGLGYLLYFEVYDALY